MTLPLEVSNSRYGRSVSCKSVPFINFSISFKESSQKGREKLTRKLCGAILSALDRRRTLIDQQSSLSEQIAILEKISNPSDNSTSLNEKVGSELKVNEEKIEHENMKQKTSSTHSKSRPVAFVPPRMLSQDKKNTVSPVTTSAYIVQESASVTSPTLRSPPDTPIIPTTGETQRKRGRPRKKFKSTDTNSHRRSSSTQSDSSQDSNKVEFDERPPLPQPQHPVSSNNSSNLLSTFTNTYTTFQTHEQTAPISFNESTFLFSNNKNDEETKKFVKNSSKLLDAVRQHNLCDRYGKQSDGVTRTSQVAQSSASSVKTLTPNLNKPGLDQNKPGLDQSKPESLIPEIPSFNQNILSNVPTNNNVIEFNMVENNLKVQNENILYKSFPKFSISTTNLHKRHQSFSASTGNEISHSVVSCSHATIPVSSEARNSLMSPVTAKSRLTFMTTNSTTVLSPTTFTAVNSTKALPTVTSVMRGPLNSTIPIMQTPGDKTDGCKMDTLNPLNSAISVVKAPTDKTVGAKREKLVKDESKTNKFAEFIQPAKCRKESDVKPEKQKRKRKSNEKSNLTGEQVRNENEITRQYINLYQNQQKQNTTQDQGNPNINGPFLLSPVTGNSRMDAQYGVPHVEQHFLESLQKLKESNRRELELKSSYQHPPSQIKNAAHTNTATVLPSGSPSQESVVSVHSVVASNVPVVHHITHIPAHMLAVINKDNNHLQNLVKIPVPVNGKAQYKHPKELVHQQNLHTNLEGTQQKAMIRQPTSSLSSNVIQKSMSHLNSNVPQSQSGDSRPKKVRISKQSNSQTSVGTVHQGASTSLKKMPIFPPTPSVISQPVSVNKSGSQTTKLTPANLMTLPSSTLPGGGHPIYVSNHPLPSPTLNIVASSKNHIPNMHIMQVNKTMVGATTTKQPQRTPVINTSNALKFSHQQELPRNDNQHCISSTVPVHRQELTNYPSAADLLLQPYSNSTNICGISAPPKKKPRRRKPKEVLPSGTVNSELMNLQHSLSKHLPQRSTPNQIAIINTAHRQPNSTNTNNLVKNNSQPNATLDVNTSVTQNVISGSQASNNTLLPNHKGYANCYQLTPQNNIMNLLQAQPNLMLLAGHKNNLSIPLDLNHPFERQSSASSPTFPPPKTGE